MKKITAMQFRRVEEPITSLKTKFGGQPVWLEIPQWPLDLHGKPLHFVCQIAIDDNIFPNAEGQIAYLFISNEEEAETWDPNAGDTAVIMQPGIPLASIKFENNSQGPSLLEGEYDVELCLKEEAYQVVPELLDEDAYKEYFRALSGSKIGGTPLFIQGEEYPKGFERLLMQIDTTAVPFNINFGDSGTGYLFMNATGSQGKFLWQCY